MQHKYITALLLSIITIQAHAGFNGLTWHSRANCLTFNESITWDATHYHWLKTFSKHYYFDPYGHYRLDHEEVANMEYTWRSAAYHMGELQGNGKWQVEGTHSEKSGGEYILYEETSATDCSIYDGWWQKDHPERKS